MNNSHAKVSVLWEATRDLHHACEAHPVGAAMAAGTPPEAWYACWVTALHQLHQVVDGTLPPTLNRVGRLEADIAASSLQQPLQAAARYAASLTTEPALAGAAYVLIGAHLMGGEIMRRRLLGFPTAHLEWDDRKDGLAWLKIARDRGEVAQEARDCFAALLAVMDETQQRYPQ